jgi:YD repeat-containing protein
MRYHQPLKLSLYFICCLLFFADTIFGQDVFKLKGQVKSSTIYFYPSNPNNSSGKWDFKSEIRYDRNGQQNGAKVFVRSGARATLISIESYEYDEKGRRTKIIRVLTRDTNKTTYTYDLNQNLVETYYAWVGKGETFRIVHDEKKQVDTLYHDGKLTASKITRHISKFRDEEISFYLGLTILTNDSSRAPVNNEPTAHKKLITYDEHRNIVDEVTHDSNGQKESHKISRYDKNNNLINLMDSGWVNARDNLENKHKLYAASTTTFRYDKLDKAGNWLEQYTVVNDKFILTTRRKLQYY